MRGWRRAGGRYRVGPRAPVTVGRGMVETQLASEARPTLFSRRHWPWMSFRVLLLLVPDVDIERTHGHIA